MAFPSASFKFNGIHTRRLKYKEGQVPTREWNAAMMEGGLGGRGRPADAFHRVQASATMYGM